MIISDSKEGISQLVQTLNGSEPVVIPTETVYGLAAKIDDLEAIKKIFLYKKRPFFDPLIVHISQTKELDKLTAYKSEILDRLTTQFWPGPLTLVLPKLNSVSDLITAGLDSVGVRVPSHPLALKLLKSVGSPLAAPSANLFGQTSPTSAAHVEADFPNLKILDGGNCQVGIESTVLKIQPVKNQDVSLSMLRRGIVTVKDIDVCLQGLESHFQWSLEVDKKFAPGHMKHHYMPKVPIVYFGRPVEVESYLTRIQDDFNLAPNEVDNVSIVKPKSNVTRYEDLTFNEDPTIACRELYAELKIKSETNSQILVFKKQPYMVGEVWDAFLERITKASSLRYDI